MKTTIVDDQLYGALEAAARRSGRQVPEVVNEALTSWLADAAMDDAERDLIEEARVEATEQGGVEFEAFFDDLDRNRN